MSGDPFGTSRRGEHAGVHVDELAERGLIGRALLGYPIALVFLAELPGSALTSKERTAIALRLLAGESPPELRRALWREGMRSRALHREVLACYEAADVYQCASIAYCDTLDAHRRRQLLDVAVRLVDLARDGRAQTVARLALDLRDHVDELVRAASPRPEQEKRDAA